MELGVQPERVIGRYAIAGEIASGGMATVHLGRLLGPVGFSRIVAIKRLHAQFARDPEFVSMFLDEARLAARIQHPNVVSTLDVVARDGELFLVMEYIEGDSFSSLLRASRLENRPVPVPVAVAITVGMLRGLHAAHEALNERGEPMGVIHRDVSPHNVLVGADGVPRMVDFGVAKALGQSHQTREGVLKGKVAYMAPEQVQGEPLDRRVDVYAAAIVLWEALTFRRPFVGENPLQIAGHVLRGLTTAPSELRTGIPQELDDIVLRACARAADSRYPTASDFADALEDAWPSVSPRSIGRWVTEVAGPVLVTRSARVRALESSSDVLGVGPSEVPTSLFARDPPPAREGQAVASAAPDSLPAPIVDQPATRSASRKPLFVVLGLGGVAAVALTGLVFAYARTRAPGERPGASSVQAASMPREPTNPTKPAQSSSAPPTVLSTASADPVAAAPSGVAAPLDGGAQATRPKAKAPPARSACDPPYTIDANGRKRFKLECL